MPDENTPTPKKSRAALHSRLGDLFNDLQPVEADANQRPSQDAGQAPAPVSPDGAALTQAESPVPPGDGSAAGTAPWLVVEAAVSPEPAAQEEPDVWLPETQGLPAEAAAVASAPAAAAEPGEEALSASPGSQALEAALLTRAVVGEPGPAQDDSRAGAAQVEAEFQVAPALQEDLDRGPAVPAAAAAAVRVSPLDDSASGTQGRRSLRGKSWGDFVLLGGVTLLLAVLILLSSPLLAIPVPLIYLSPLRVALGVFYLLFVPGYFLTAAIFPQKEDLDGLERAGLSLGLSVVILPLQALLLNQLPVGLTFQSMVAMALGSGLLLLLVALIQRWRLPAQVVAESFGPLSPRRWWRGLSRSDRLSYLVVIPILLLTVVAAGWAVTASFAEGRGGVTTSEFFILGEEGLAQDYPRQARAGQPLSVTFGIHNQEGQQELYRVEARNGPNLVGVAGPFTLQDDETLNAPLDFTPVQVGENQRIDILLYRGASQEAYRSLALWLAVDEP